MAAQRRKNDGDTVHTESPTVVQDSATVTVTPIDGVLEVSLTTGYTVNIGDFNNKSVKGSVAGRFSTQVDIEDVAAYLNEKLYTVIQDEMLTAKALAPAQSYIHRISID